MDIIISSIVVVVYSFSLLWLWIDIDYWALIIVRGDFWTKGENQFRLAALQSKLDWVV